jgi:putative sigma-54 modulation protein
MDIAFRARNVEVPDGLRHATVDKVARLGSRCGIDRAEVCFSEERNPRISEREVCEITLFGPGGVLRAQAAATDVAVAADRVVGKLEQRADRLRGRRMDRLGRRSRRSVHSPADEPMTPEEAALEMVARGGDISFFVNAETGRAAVVYRRTDGDVGVVT